MLDVHRTHGEDVNTQQCRAGDEHEEKPVIPLQDIKDTVSPFHTMRCGDKPTHHTIEGQCLNVISVFDSALELHFANTRKRMHSLNFTARQKFSEYA